MPGHQFRGRVRRLTRRLAGGAVVAGLMLGGGSAFAQQPDTAADAAAVVVPVRSLGSAQAPVTIDLYESFLCDNCALWRREELPQIRRALVDTGKARIVFHDVPVDPVPLSVRAAMIGLCAGPEQYFATSEAFVTGLAALREGGTVQAWFDGAIAASGTDRAEMEACSNSEATYEQVRQETREAASLQIRKLPTLLIKGQRLAEPSAAVVATAVAEATPADGE